MIEASEALRILAAFLFWSLADIVLVAVWLVILITLITLLVKGLFND